MRSRLLIFVSFSLFVLCLSFTATAVEPGVNSYQPASFPTFQPGIIAAKNFTAEWSDTVRNRVLPVKIYYPGSGNGPWPLIIFSSGFDGSGREGYQFLAITWASRGFITLIIEHERPVGSALESLLRSSGYSNNDYSKIVNPANTLQRYQDVGFVISNLEKLNQTEDFILNRQIDLSKIGLSGLSYGAQTALNVSGRKSVSSNPVSIDGTDPRIKACIALSILVEDPSIECKSLQNFSRPCMYISGSNDRYPLEPTLPSTRRALYDCVKTGHQYLIVFQGGDHQIFIPAATAPDAKNPIFKELALQGTTAFWDVYLKNNKAALAWLEQGGYQKALGTYAAYERK